MIELSSITIDDINWAKPILQSSENLGCEYNFANNLAWSRTYNARICKFDEFYILSSGRDEEIRFMFPAGTGDFAKVFFEMKKYSENFSRKLELYGVTEKTLPIIKSVFGDRFNVIEERDSFDYIYTSLSLSTLSGKKYHSKRNHLKRFFAEYDAEFCDLQERDFDDCIAFAAKSYNENLSYDDASAVGEQYAIHTYFEHFDRLSMNGAVLKIGGKVCAFTLGSTINQCICDINIEKADKSIEGSYIAICNYFAKSFGVSFEYINREEDLGIEGLRKSKLSYKPAFLLKKYRVIVD